MKSTKKSLTRKTTIDTSQKASSVYNDQKTIADVGHQIASTDVGQETLSVHIGKKGLFLADIGKYCHQSRSLKKHHRMISTGKILVDISKKNSLNRHSPKHYLGQFKRYLMSIFFSADVSHSLFQSTLIWGFSMHVNFFGRCRSVMFFGQH